MGNKLYKRQLRLEQEEIRQQTLRTNEKTARRAEKAARAEQSQLESDGIDRTGPLDCACLIHSTGYSWDYVERLYNMLRRNLRREIRFHVYTEHDRSVPPHMIKHVLTEWDNCAGPRKSWWYKLQLFNIEHHAGPLLYFDLDTVVVNRLDWLPELNLKFLWAAKDFRSLWRPSHTGINSSVMYWDTRRFAHVWQDFRYMDLQKVMKQYHGDQDYISSVIHQNMIRYFLPQNVMSWRWQVKDGGMNFRNRIYLAPGTGTALDHRTSVLIFHGSPKPHEVRDPVIQNFWQ
jgi:hypothetical protein